MKSRSAIQRSKRKNLTWSLIATGSTLLAGIVAQKIVEKSWAKARHSDPPEDPARNDVSWRDAIMWTVFSGVIVGLARLFASRAADSGWKRATGDKPPK